MALHRLILVAIISSGFALTGCDVDQGPAEETGEALDEAGENIQDAANDAGNAVEDACEDAKESADAEDTDC